MAEVAHAGGIGWGVGGSGNGWGWGWAGGGEAVSEPVAAPSAASPTPSQWTSPHAGDEIRPGSSNPAASSSIITNVLITTATTTAATNPETIPQSHDENSPTAASTSNPPTAASTSIPPSIAPTPQSASKASTVTGAVSITVVLLAIAGCLLAFFLFRRRRRRKQGEGGAFDSSNFRKSAVKLEDSPVNPPTSPGPPSIIEILRHSNASVDRPAIPSYYESIYRGQGPDTGRNSSQDMSENGPGMSASQHSLNLSKSSNTHHPLAKSHVPTYIRGSGSYINLA